MEQSVDRECARYFAASRTPVAVVGFDEAVRHVNEAWTCLLESVPPGASLADRLSVADRDAVTAAIGRLKDGGSAELCVTLVEDDGSRRAFTWELSAEPGGTCLYCAARAVDEPDRGDALRAALLRALEETEALGLYMITSDVGRPARVVYANAAAERMLGIDDLQARVRAGDITHAEVQRRVEDAIAGAVSAEFAEGFAEVPTEFERRLRDGRSVRWLVLPVDDARGQVRGRLFVSKDVTERKLAEEAMALAHDRQKRSEAEFRRLLEHVPDGIVVMREGRFAYANPAAARILGYDVAEELIGVHFASIVRPEELLESDERVRLMGGAAPPPRRVRPMVRRDGSTVYAETLGFQTELDGAPATLVIAHDVTEERRLQAQMRQAEQLASLGTIAATIAHEINNPLTYILLNLHVIRRWLGKLAKETPSQLLDDTLRLTEQSLEGADRVRVIVGDLRGFSRADDDVASLVDVRTVLDSVLPMTEHELRDRGAVVRDYEEASPEPLVRANATLLGHVFLNLLVNAAQTIVNDGRVDHEVRIGVRTVPDDGGGGNVVVTFRDTGQGMPRHVRERVFEPFFTTKPPGVGTGLGLSLCLQRVRALGGDITVESEVGLGSTFTVSLPLSTAEPASDEASRTPVTIPRLRVLVVDDEPRIAERLAELLEAHEVEVAPDGPTALARLRETRFDVVFCDLMMPDLKGTEVYEAACRERPDHADRFIFMTAGAFTPKARALLDSSASPRLDKPFTEADVQHVLALVVSRVRRR